IMGGNDDESGSSRTKCSRQYETVKESAYEFDEVCADDELQIKKIIKFRLGGRAHNLTLLEFARRLGLYHAKKLDEEGFDVYFQGGLRSDEHFKAQEYWLSISQEENLSLSRSHASTIRNPVLRVLHKMITYGLYANVAWLIARWMKRKGAGTQRGSQICCIQFIIKLTRKERVLSDKVLRSLSAPIYYRYLDTTTLRELIDSEGRLIPEDLQPDVPRVAIPRAQRASMYARVFEHMAGVYSVSLGGAYNPLGFAQSQYDQYYQQYPPQPPQYQQHRQDDENGEMTKKSESTQDIFLGLDDAKEIWAAIKTRFGGNTNSKKMQKAADYVLREIHAGSCSMHSGPRSVVARALRSGYYWPTMHRDARDMIRKCNDCQVHRPIPRQPQQELTPITSPWPFHKWGIDIAGPFPAAAGGLKFLIVAIDYFTKWIEAKAVATITGNQVKRFVWDNIVCRFGLPGEIVSDNGKQFCDNPFKDWCARLSITQRFASVKHPQTNGLVERANRSLGEGIKARLDRHKGRWVEELSHVLWAHRTTIKVSTGDTPFSLVYGTEAVIPAEIGMPTIRTAEVNIATNDDERRIDLDILEERREQAAIREEKAKLQMKGYYDAKVRGVSFRPGDFVYRANDASHAEDTGKLGPKWEGPYEVTEALGKGAYKLRDMDGRELPRTWNICNLKKCYL
ncbi:reverse transcriptase domain-containing protein, partial [Tanacetum coccineum]